MGIWGRKRMESGHLESQEGAEIVILRDTNQKERD
jgi:hypothetical protein